MRRVAVAVVVLPVLWGAGCSDDGDDVASTSTSTSTSSSTTSSTTTAPSAVEHVQLRGDGLGAVPFGSTFDAALAALTDLLGEPTEIRSAFPFDEGCVTLDGCRSAPACSTATLRASLAWPGLRLTFVGQTETDLVLTAWMALREPELISVPTVAGLSLTDPIQRWEDEYGASLRHWEYVPPSGEGQPWTDAIEVQLPEGPLNGLSELGRPPTQIASLEAGDLCMGLSDV